MSSILSSWFPSMRSNESEGEMDGPLTSDIDSAFLGLEMTNNTFNLSNESLLMPLGICKSEISSQSSCSKHKVSDHNGNCTVQLLDGTAVTENTSPTILTSSCGHYIPTDSALEPPGQLVNLIGCGDGFSPLNGNCSQFQHILMAPTSPATKLNEETVTYLNQGHSYEIKLKKLGNNGDCEGFLYRSIVRVVFHERRLQFMEREQLETWRQTRPGERLVDIDIPLSYGLIDVRIDPQDLNCVEFVWDPRRDAGVFVKVHCISTEFTAKKHGGEKGVSFRVQLETYHHNLKVENYQENSKTSDPQIVHCASCQVKVFKPKGADRKLKTDREKMDKKSEIEREKYQPPFEYTVMTEVPIDQVCFYLDQLNRQTSENSRPNKLLLAQPRATPVSSSNGMSCNGVSQYNPFFSDLPSCRSLSHQNSNVYVDEVVSTRHQSSLLTSVDCGHGLVDSSSFEAVRSPGTPSSSHSSTSSSGAVHSGGCISTLATETEVVAWLSANRFGHLLKKFQNFAGHDILRLTRADLIEICGVSDGIRLANALAAKNIAPIITIYVSCKPDSLKESEQRISTSCIDNNNTQSSISNGHLAEQISVQTATSPGTGFTYSDFDSRPMACHPLGSSKRHLYDEDNDDCSSPSAVKRPCIYETNTVYNAVYLSQATNQHLLEQLATVAKLSLRNLRNFRLAVPSGILVHITNSVVENLVNESKFYYEIISDGSSMGWDLILTPVTSPK